MTYRGRIAHSLLTLTILFPALAASAGMRPHPTLTEIGKFRLDVVSFFAVAILTLSWMVKGVWNLFRKDFPTLPRLTYGKALGVVFLWGLLFIIVLAMISGARELMTPGAWEKRDDGGYKLTATEPEQLEFARKRQLEHLRDALWIYAKNHGGNFPPHDLVPDIADATWETIHPSHLHYLYIPGRRADQADKTIAYEPGVYGQLRLSLKSNGAIEFQKLEEIRNEINEEAR